MEWKIGEIKQVNGEWYQCLEGISCKEWDFSSNSITCDIHGAITCTIKGRSDDTSVVFKKLEKIGGPYDDCGTILQRFKIYTNVTNADTKGLELHIYCDNTIGIEIKQNKEDMEEKAIKIKKEDIEVGNKVTCLSSNRPYVIAEANCRMKYDGDWHDCVIYTPLYDNPFKCFVRPVEDFVQNFVLDSVEEKKEKHSNLESTGKNLKPFNPTKLVTKIIS